MITIETYEKNRGMWILKTCFVIRSILVRISCFPLVVNRGEKVNNRKELKIKHHIYMVYIECTCNTVDQQ